MRTLVSMNPRHDSRRIVSVRTSCAEDNAINISSWPGITQDVLIASTLIFHLSDSEGPVRRSFYGDVGSKCLFEGTQTSEKPEHLWMKPSMRSRAALKLSPQTFCHRQLAKAEGDKELRQQPTLCCLCCLHLFLRASYAPPPQMAAGSADHV